MTADFYDRPSEERRVSLRVQRSEFIGIVAPVVDEAAFGAMLDAMTREFHDATHHCWAYRFFDGEAMRSRSSDAGEPAGTAGRPILSAIEGEDLADVGVIVVRYYGGVKLGTGGLGRAYRDAARAALAEVPRERRILYRRLDVTAGFESMSEIYRLVSPPDIVLVEERFEAENHFVLDVRRSRVDEVAAKLAERRFVFSTAD